MDEAANPVVSTAVESAPQEESTQDITADESTDDVSTEEESSQEESTEEETDEEDSQDDIDATESEEVKPSRAQERIKQLAEARNAAIAESRISQAELSKKDAIIARLSEEKEALIKQSQYTPDENGEVSMADWEKSLITKVEAKNVELALNRAREEAALLTISIERSKIFEKDANLATSAAHQELFSSLWAQGGTATLSTGEVVPLGSSDAAYEAYQKVLSGIVDSVKNESAIEKARKSASEINKSSAARRTGSPATVDGNFTVADVDNMSTAEYKKNKEKIDRQVAAGTLI